MPLRVPIPPSSFPSRSLYRDSDAPFTNVPWHASRSPHTSFQFPLTEPLQRQRCFLYKRSLARLSECPVPPRAPRRAPISRDDPFPETFFLPASESRQQSCLLPLGGPHEERCPFPEPSFTYLFTQRK
jgi:hypothetical protein